MKYILSAVAVCLQFCLTAQTAYTWSVTYFAQEGEKFFVVYNGERQNEVAQTNVKITGLNGTMYKAKIIFESGLYPEINHNSMAPMEPGEMVYNIRQDKHSKYVGRLHSFNPAAQNTPPVPTPAPTPPPTPRTVESTTITTTTTTPGVNANVSVPGMDVSVRISDPTLDVRTTTTTQTTTTTTRTEELPPAVLPVGCLGGYPMSSADFGEALNSVKGQGFDETRLKVAKQITSANCVSVQQVKQVIKCFSFEDTRLSYAKYAYEFCTDRNKYYLVNDEFSFSSSVDDLTNYIGH